MIEWIPTVVSISISAVMRLFGRGGKTGASNRETEVNQRSGDASTQVVSGDHAIMNFGTANVDAVPSNPVLTPALRWHDCPHLRPERVSLDEVKAVSAFVSLRLLYGGSPSSGSPFHQECINPGCNRRCYRSQLQEAPTARRAARCQDPPPVARYRNQHRNQREMSLALDFLRGVTGLSGGSPFLVTRVTTLRRDLDTLAMKWWSVTPLRKFNARSISRQLNCTREDTQHGDIRPAHHAAP